MSEPSYVSVPDVFMTSDASLTLQQKAPASLDARIVPAHHIAYDVEAYWIAEGQPVADTALGIDCTVEVETGDMAADGSFEKPWSVEVTEALAPQSRWLPLEGTFDTGVTWEAFAGDDRVDLVTEGTDAVLDTEFAYARGRRFVNGQAMRLDDGDYFFTDGARWSSDQVACAMVVVLRTPMVDAYGLFETYDRDGLDPDRAFVGVRYTTDGVVQAHSRGLLGEIQTSSQGARTGQPIIVAFSLSQTLTWQYVTIPGRLSVPRQSVNSQLDVIVADRTVTRLPPINLGAPHPFDARLFVGRAPGKTMGAASMDILEVDYWTDLDGDGLMEKVHILDRLYGVTS